MNSIVRARDLQPSLAVQDFKDAMRQLPGGVSVITVGQGADVNGMTVSSVSSFSVDPPTMLVSINRNASSYPMLVRTGVFGINVLAADQREVAERFSGRNGVTGINRFANADWRSGATGVPLLVGAAAAIDCTVDDIFEKHSHAIIIGRVVSVRSEALAGATAYWNGQYTALQPDKSAVYDTFWY
jgi:flavin reductase (DIM6/NTAB) family NADH-FMN oxidoreductase RutF